MWLAISAYLYIMGALIFWLSSRPYQGHSSLTVLLWPVLVPLSFISAMIDDFASTPPRR